MILEITLEEAQRLRHTWGASFYHEQKYSDRFELLNCSEEELLEITKDEESDKLCRMEWCTNYLEALILCKAYRSEGFKSVMLYDTEGGEDFEYAVLTDLKFGSN